MRFSTTPLNLHHLGHSKLPTRRGHGLRSADDATLRQKCHVIQCKKSLASSVRLTNTELYADLRWMNSDSTHSRLLSLGCFPRHSAPKDIIMHSLNAAGTSEIGPRGEQETRWQNCFSVRMEQSFIQDATFSDTFS